MKKVVLIFILMIVSVNIFAQVSGYMGKRLSVEYNNMFFVALRNPTTGEYKYSDSYFDRILSINTRNNFSLDYIISRRKSIGFGVDFFKTRHTLSSDFQYSYTNSSGISASNNSTLKYLPACNVSSTCFNLHYTFFNRESLAPLGKYGQLEFGLIRYLSTIDDEMLIEELEYNNDVYEVTEISINENNIYHTFYMGFTFGRKRIYFDRIIINSGMQFCVVPDAFSNMNMFLDTKNLNKENYLDVLSKKRLLNHMMINLKLGIGLLVF